MDTYRDKTKKNTQEQKQNDGKTLGKKIYIQKGKKMKLKEIENQTNCYCLNRGLPSTSTFVLHLWLDHPSLMSLRAQFPP